MICAYDEGTYCFDEEKCKESGVCQHPVYKGNLTRFAASEREDEELFDGATLISLNTADLSLEERARQIANFGRDIRASALARTRQSREGVEGRIVDFIASLCERADVLDGGKPIRTCSVHASARADAFRQIAAELGALGHARETAPAERRKLLTQEEIIWRAEENRRRRWFWAIYFLLLSLFFAGVGMTPNGYWWMGRHIEWWEGFLAGSVAELVVVFVSKWCGDRLAWIKWFSWQ